MNGEVLRLFQVGLVARDPQVFVIKKQHFLEPQLPYSALVTE